MGTIKKAVQTVDISKLKPYENNAKIHTPKQIEKLKASIEEFGFMSPILIDNEFNIIAGHGRLEGAKAAGLKTVPCITAEGLSEEQRKAYILADNKLSELGVWDLDLVNVEMGNLAELDFDTDLTGFSLKKLSEMDAGYYGDERKRTNDAYNLDEAKKLILTNDFWQMPEIENDHFVPTDLIGFNYAKSSTEKKAGIHFFIDDYQFERIWNAPDKYIDVLKEYECILTPDFSLYMDMPMPMKIWNVYRSRFIGAYYQKYGVKVIPTISWAERETFDFCFAGIPKGSIVAISTIGVKENSELLKVWKDGVGAMIKEIKPSTILIYGGKIDFDFGSIKTKYYENNVLKKWRDKR